MQLRSLLSGHDALTLLETIQGSFHCNTEKDFVCLFSKIQELFSFEFSCALLGFRENNEVVIAGGVNISYQPDFYGIYKSKNGLREDIITNQHFQDYALQYWTIHKKRPAQSQEIVSLAADFGMKTGYVHGSKPFGQDQYGSIFSFAGARINPEARTAAILNVMIPHLHLSLSQLHRKKHSAHPGIILSKREKEVLNWVGQGKSSWDISVILHISESTVNFHIYNIMQKLGAVNRSQMVAVATRQGLIDIH